MQLGSPLRFWNEASSSDSGEPCFPLVVSGMPLGFLFGYYQVEGRLFVFRCIEGKSSFHLDPDQRYGHVERSPHEWKDHRLQPLEIPGWSIIANPAYCGPYVAYWSTQGENVHAAIFHLLSGQMVVNKGFSLPSPATDNEGHLPAPSWEPADHSVRFLTDQAPGQPPLVLKVP